MGYTIRIGQIVAVMPDQKSLEQYGYSEPYFTVEETTSEKAPCFPGDPAGRSNQRDPSYSGWGDFLREVGLDELFRNETSGLMRRHPGVMGLGSHHLDAVTKALEAYGPRTMRAGICDCRGCQGFGVNERHEEFDPRSYNMARLLWLEWWMGWALKNCKHPGISNG